jgi:hypothetical protein
MTTSTSHTTEYRCHWWPTGAQPVLTPSVTVDARSTREGAALALRQLLQLGCELNAPHAHLDLIGLDGARHTVLVEELIDWLRAPEQATFVAREGLDELLRGR